MQFITKENEIICIENDKEAGKITFPETETGVFEIDHTFVSEDMQGKGIATQLVRHALNEIARRGGEVRASCSYAKRYIEKHGLRPVVICHMMTSIDGKVTGDFLYSRKGLEVSETYYEINRRLKGEAFACGRVTMESSFTNGYKPDLSGFNGDDITYEDHIATKHERYAVSFDTCGKVGWTESCIHDSDPGYDNCHIIEILTEKTPKKMLEYYRSIGISYIFAGEEKIDVKTALDKLYSAFGIKKLLLEGGSIINSAFLKDDLVDELSLIVAPMIAATNDKPLFEEAEMCSFVLTEAQVVSDGSVWLRYTK